MSAEFDFSDSLNDVAPASSMLLSVDGKKKGEKWFADGYYLYILGELSRLSTARVLLDFNNSLNDCAPISPIWLSVENKYNNALWVDIVASFCLYALDQVQWMPCWTSTIHSETLHQFLQCHSLPIDWMKWSDLLVSAIWICSFICLYH